MSWFVVTNTHRDKDGNTIRISPALIYEDREYAKTVADINREKVIEVQVPLDVIQRAIR